MIFTAKRKTDSEEKNWCVVLKSFNSALDRTRLIQKLQQAFQISGEDAIDVMQNTPIILLDHLPQEQAARVRDYFSDNGVEVALTNDSFYKRRCYRTVWPNMPNIETILKPSSPVQAKTPQRSVPVRENVPKEIPVNPAAPSFSHAAPDTWGTSQREFLEQKEILIRDSLKLQEEVARLRAMVDRSLAQVTEKERALQVLSAEKKDRDMEVQRMESQLAASEEKFKIAREEFRDTRAYFEERLLAQESKLQDLQVQAEEARRLLNETQSSKAELEKRFESHRAEIESARTLAAAGELEWEKKTADLRRAAELHQRAVRDYESKIAHLETSRHQIEENETRLRREMEQQSFAAKNKELRAQQLEKEIERLKSAFQIQERDWESRLQQVEAREKELESARRQIRELQSQMERRELIQRKVFIAEQIAAKELRLKSLVKKQEQLEHEARDRESDLKKLLDEQESVEKGLIEDRQAQKHLLEKLKHEMPQSETAETGEGFGLNFKAPV